MYYSYIKFIFVLSGVLFCMFSSAQSEQEKEQAIAQYKKAAELRKQADVALGKGFSFKKDFHKAEKLLEEASKIYPADPGYIDYLPWLRLLKKDDMRGANQAWSEAINKLKSMNFICEEKAFGKYHFISTKNYLRDIFTIRANQNIISGDSKLASDDIMELLKMDFTEKEYKRVIQIAALNPPSIQSLLRSGQYVAFLNEDLNLLASLQELFKRMDEDLYVELGEVYIAILKNEFDKAIELSIRMETDGGSNRRLMGRFMLAWTYSLKNESAKSESYLELAKKNIFVTDKTISRIKAMNALSNSDFVNALRYANQALKPAKWVHLSYEQPGKFFLYTLRAQAYLGLKQFDKAKADFERALLYNDTYEPAIEGLAKLEGKVLEERRVDKTPPVITITDPVANRGLKVTATSSDVLIRGIASDPSGIKEVKLNDIPAYLQSENFWSNVALSGGANKVKVTAIDKAGNIAEQIVEITKETADVKTDIVPVISKEAKNYALLIAAQNYEDDAIPSLSNPVADAIKLKMLFRKEYSFSEDNIFTLFNPTALDVKKTFAELMETIQPEDNIIIFYAGHGIWQESEKKGYWLLTDAKRNDVNTWFSNKLMLDLIAKLPSRHTLLITDACFSGSVFKTRSLGADAPQALREMNEKVSRVAITSGNDSEVPDESVFMKYLVKALSENKDKYLTAQKMFINHIIEAVMNETKTEPRYGTLELAGHVGGDFIFVKK